MAPSILAHLLLFFHWLFTAIDVGKAVEGIVVVADDRLELEM